MGTHLSADTQAHKDFTQVQATWRLTAYVLFLYCSMDRQGVHDEIEELAQLEWNVPHFLIIVLLL
jgi:hypothetical protein